MKPLVLGSVPAVKYTTGSWRALLQQCVARGNNCRISCRTPWNLWHCYMAGVLPSLPTWVCTNVRGTGKQKLWRVGSVWPWSVLLSLFMKTMGPGISCFAGQWCWSQRLLNAEESLDLECMQEPHSGFWRHLHWQGAFTSPCQPESLVPSAIKTCTIKGKTPLSEVLVMVLVPQVALTWVLLLWMCQVLIMVGSSSLDWRQENQSVVSATLHALWQW